MECKKKVQGVRYDTERVAKSIFTAMLRDFRSYHSHFRPGIEKDFEGDIEQFRSRVEEFEFFGTSIGRFKAHSQVANLLKKWKFRHDVFTQEELISRSYEKYFLEQERITSSKPWTCASQRVLQEARKIAREILGRPAMDEIVLSCRFGTNSSIGCPLTLAYIDHKLISGKAFTSSKAVHDWFRGKVLPEDPVLQRILGGQVDANLAGYEQTEFLVLKDVEKTWKIRRIITPLPLLDLYFSNGVGDVVTKRLKSHGIDIARQQHRHRNWVKDMSLNRRSATADLSSASDSITNRLLNAVLPREWYVLIKPLLCHQLRLDCPDSGITRFCYTDSVLPMGNGLTFPLETLMFYCLIKALGNLTGIRGLFSVYGDDLIYPSRLHPYVASIFPKLGLILNMEKTFVGCDFRESCGSDFYRGVDVRSYYLKGESQYLTRTRYLAFLYGIVNGLRLRWDYSELPQTFLWLFQELSLASFGSGVLRVPEQYPATAGVHTSSPSRVPMGLWAVDWSPIHVAFKHGSRAISFKYLTEVPTRRYTISVQPYYWLALQSRYDVSVPWDERNREVRVGAEPQLRWHMRKVPIRDRKKSDRTYRTAVVWYSSVADKSYSHIKENTGSVADWT